MLQVLRRTWLSVVLMLGLMLGAVGVASAQEEPSVTVGSKNFTEQLIVAEMIGLMLEDAGYDVDRQLDLGGTAIAHEALIGGDIDVYVEYTGTGLIAILGMELPDEAENGDAATPEDDGPIDEVYEIVAAEYPEEFGVEWLEPWGFNNTFALIVTSETAEEYDLESISDLEDVAGDLIIGTEPEFPVRPDGLPGIEELYGFSFEGSQTADAGLLYDAVVEEEVDVIAGVSTDGRIPAYDLVILEDDLSFFPPYFAAPVVSQELLEEAPEIADILNQLSGAISDDEMAAMNYEVDDEDLEPIEVAQQFLEDEGILEADE